MCTTGIPSIAKAVIDNGDSKSHENIFRETDQDFGSLSAAKPGDIMCLENGLKITIPHISV